MRQSLVSVDTEAAGTGGVAVALDGPNMWAQFQFRTLTYTGHMGLCTEMG